ncbi:Protein FAM72A [Symbiodinium microadriaticum]|uniref:Protein FAM72A n=1 Tax=Symbiodinium microadriaticum TaxID=2951 RepID=A0A1Q9DD22_SYMMI|nr:Protein FAM72A [Symbiodinium microadriaticum]
MSAYAVGSNIPPVVALVSACQAMQAQAKDRRASRAWRLTPAVISPPDANQHRQERAFRSQSWEEPETSHPSAVFNIFCSSCHYLLSEHGEMMQMMASPSSFAFSTSQPPHGVILTGSSCKSQESCDCKVQDFQCRCGVRLGYYLESPCAECRDSKTLQKWFLCPRSVEVEPHEPEDLPPKETGNLAALHEKPNATSLCMEEDFNGHRHVSEFPEHVERAVGEGEPVPSHSAMKSQPMSETFTLGRPRAGHDLQGRIQEAFRACQPLETATPACRPRSRESVSCQTDFAKGDNLQPDAMISLKEARCEALEAQLRVSQAAESAALAEARAARAAEIEIEDWDIDSLQALPGSRLEFAQRLAEKRMELERWQQALQHKSQRLEEVERTLCTGARQKPSQGFASSMASSMPQPTAKDVLAATAREVFGTAEFMAGTGFVAVKAVAKAGLIASRLVIALAKPVFGGLKAAGRTTANCVTGYIQSALEKAALDAQQREIAQAAAIRVGLVTDDAETMPTASQPKQITRRSSVPRDAEKERELATQTAASASATSASKSAASRRITGQAGILSLAQHEESPIGHRTASPADKDVRDALARLFVAFDEDGDGLLRSSEFAIARKLVASTFKASESQLVGPGAADLVGRDAFVATMLASTPSHLSTSEVVQQINKMISGSRGNFEKSVSDLRHVIVRNVSGLPESPPKPLWRTATGRGAFTLPPGVASGPLIARIAFKVMQYLAMRTEDATCMDGGLIRQVASHRQTFKKLLDRAGEIAGARALPSADGKSVDLYLMKSSAGEVFRVCLQNLQLSSGPDPVLEGIGGFDVGPVEPATIPKELWAEMCQPDGLCRSEAPDPKDCCPELKRNESDFDWQNAPLMLKVMSASRHVFRVRFSLVGNELSSRYIVLIPKLRTVKEGHARYASHHVSVRGLTDSATTDFQSFVLLNLPGDQLSHLAVEHDFVNQQVRVQQGDTVARARDGLDAVIPVPVLTPEERASSLACDGRELRSLLSSQGLGRLGGERDIVYAVRLGRHLRHGYKYDVALAETDLNSLPTSIWKAKRGDCSSFNVGFVFALRAHQIPARISLGFKYGQAVFDACGSVVAPHVQCEFFAEGVGWIPCDATAGVHRLGHEATGMLSFLEFRSASLTVQDLQDLRKVFGPTVGPVELHENSQRDPSSSSKDVLKASVSDPSVTASQSRQVAAAHELGKFRDLRTADPLTDCARAGAKMFEGGPFRGQPLKLGQLNENMLVPAEIDAVMDHLKARPRSEDWSKMWPYGVISCSYEFEQKPA